MRLFVALVPPAAALADADAAVAPVRARFDGPRWIPAERWHLTLAFYGEVPEGNLDGTRDMLTRRLHGATPLTLQLRGAGEFSRRALWLGVAGEVDALRRLARSVTFERRPFRPHLTIARLRGSVPAREAVEALAGYAGPPWTAATVHLVRSHLGPRPRYEDVATWALPTAP